MRKELVTAGVILALPLLSMAQSPILKNMTDKSSDVLAVTCEGVTGGMTDEAGVEEWTAACRVDLVIKGNLSVGMKILVHFNRFTFGTKPEALSFAKETLTR